MIRSIIFIALITLSGTAFTPIHLAYFDRPTGTWKRTAMTLLESSGKTTDMHKMMETNMLCTNKHEIFLLSIFLLVESQFSKPVKYGSA